MRRVLYTALVAIAALGVLANNMLEVTAPTVAGELDGIESPQSAASADHRPSTYGSAHLSGVSDDPVPPAAMPEIPVEPAGVFEREHLTARTSQGEESLEFGTRASDVDREADVQLPLYVSSWTEIPMASARHYARMNAGVPANSDMAFAARTASGPARINSSARIRPALVAALSAAPGSSIAGRKLQNLPELPTLNVSSGNVHAIPDNFLALVESERYVRSDADRTSVLPMANSVSAWSQSPGDLFSRPRYAAMPQAPVILPAVSTAALGSSIAGRKLQNLPELPAFNVSLGNIHAVPDNFLAVVDSERAARPDADRASVLPTANFVAAWSQTPNDLFARPRYAEIPNEPVILPTASVAADHAAFTSASLEVVTRNSISMPDTSFANPAVFVTASYQTPTSTFDRPRSVLEPAAPRNFEAAFVSDSHVSVKETAAIVEDRTAPAAPDTDRELRSTLPDFVTAAYQVPSAIVEKIRSLELPEKPAVDAPAASVSNSHFAFNSFGGVQEMDRSRLTSSAVSNAAPVTISADTAMAQTMVTPLKRDVLQGAPMFSEASLVAMNANAGASQFDRMIDSPASAGRGEQLPVLISGKSEFSMDLLKPLSSAASPFVGLDREEIGAALAQDGNYCDPNWVGPPIRFSQTVELKLDDLIRQLHQRFGVNFIVGKGVADLPMNIKAGSIPWNVLLKSQLFISGVRARCIDSNTIELIENRDLPGLQDMADVETRFLKLKFLQRTGSGTVDLANRSQGGQNGNQGGGCGGNNQGGTSGSIQGGGGQGGGQQGQTAGQLSNNKFDKLVIEIEKILGLRSMQESSVGGGQGGQGGGAQTQQTEVIRTNRFVTQIPGRNILAIRATKEEHDLIDQIVARADRPPFQVVIKGLVYTANQDRLRDIGVQTTITGGTADNRSNGGIFGDTLGVGTLFDFSTILGTFDFNVQATAFQQNGVISVKSRPFATVIDGLCTTLDVGRQLPIVIDSTLGGQGDVVFVNAANNLAVTPYVIDDDNGNPMAVTLELRLTANDIDSSVTSRGVPAISARSIQTQLLLGEDKTAILGGFTVDSDSRTLRKTPGLGDIPIIGELFRRRIRDTRINRLYFAISVDVIPYPDAIRPVDVPGATTDPPSITPEMKLRGDKAEPKQVPPPKKDPNDR